MKKLRLPPGNPAILLFGLLAAVFYCSWPLGYLLNPVVTQHQLASELEQTNQPYFWVFVGGDVLTGVAALIAGALQLRLRMRPGPATWAVWGYIWFGALVAMAALTPLNCNPQTASCGPLIHHPFVILHGFGSIVSVLLLLGSVIAVGLEAYKDHLARTVRAFVIILALWAVFGIGSLLDMSYHFSFNGNLLQYFFITLCSVSIIAVITVAEQLSLPHRGILTEKRQRKA